MRKALTKAQVRDMWIARLESGEVKQAKQALGYADGSRCCLGVLCDLAVAHKVVPPPTVVSGGGMASLSYDGSGGYLPEVVRIWAGLRTVNGYYPAGAFGAAPGALNSDNDSGKTFPQIAEIIRNTPSLCLSLLLVFSLYCAASARAQQPGVYTRCYDNARTCANTQETVLTPAAVLQHKMVLETTIPVIGDARGMEAWPLVAPGVPNVTDQLYANDVMVLPSMANIVRGVDPVTGAGFWQTPQLCVPVRSVRENDMWGVNDYFGFLSTGVIDHDTNKLYQVATCSKDGSGSQHSMQQRMFVLDLRTGAVLASVLVSGSDAGMNYGDAPRKQRGGLALWKRDGVKFVMVEAGSFAETGPNATGWLLAFDTFDDQFKAAKSTHAGLWQSGLGPAIDDGTGLIYVGAGNGPYDHVTAFGESAMPILFTPPTATSAASFAVLHAWALFSDAARTCANPQLTTAKNVVPAIAGQSLPSAVPGAAMPMAADCSPAWGDQDAWLTGTLVRQYGLYVGAGKDGVGVVIDTKHFPDTQPADFADPKKNCAKVKLYEFGWNLGVDPCPVKMADLNRFPDTKTRHQHSPIAQLVQNGVTYLLFFGENSPLQVWRLNPDGTARYIARGAEMASAGATGMHGGMPGGFPVVSSHDGGQDAIAWCSVPDGDANRTVTTGRLIAYDLRNLRALEGTGKMIPTLWKSEPYVFNKFMTPMVWRGRVYLPNYNGGVMVRGLGRSLRASKGEYHPRVSQNFSLGSTYSRDLCRKFDLDPDEEVRR